MLVHQMWILPLAYGGFVLFGTSGMRVCSKLNGVSQATSRNPWLSGSLPSTLPAYTISFLMFLSLCLTSKHFMFNASSRCSSHRLQLVLAYVTQSRAFTSLSLFAHIGCLTTLSNSAKLAC